MPDTDGPVEERRLPGPIATLVIVTTADGASGPARTSDPDDRVPARHDRGTEFTDAVDAHAGVAVAVDGHSGPGALFARPIDAVAMLASLAAHGRVALDTGDVGDPDPSERVRGHLADRVRSLLARARPGDVIAGGATVALVGGSLPDGWVLAPAPGDRDDESSFARPARLVRVALGPDASAPSSSSAGLSSFSFSSVSPESDGGAGDASVVGLPRALTSFVGRRVEIADLGGLVKPGRLVTITGPGGSGKTRLSMEVASHAAPGFEHRVMFCDLTSATSTEDVVGLVATAVNAPLVERDPLAGPQRALSGGPALLVLDNCEHVVDAVATVVDGLRRECPDLAVLATSREVLGVAGEHVFPLGALGLPRGDRPVDDEELLDFPAIRLFVERASRVDPGWSPAGQEPAILRVCEGVDGLPLAIELAVARVRVASVEQIAESLDRRFRLLTGGPRTAPDRHRTLEGCLDWSYELLDPPDATLLRRLGVLTGSFDVDAVVALAEAGEAASDPVDALGRLTELVDKSLVTALGDGRFRLLETVRAYALARLDERDERAGVAERHATWILGEFEGMAQTGDMPAGPDLPDHVEAGLAHLDAIGDRDRFVMLVLLGWSALAARDPIRAMYWIRRAMSFEPPDEGRAWLLVGAVMLNPGIEGLPPPERELVELRDLAEKLGEPSIRAMAHSAASSQRLLTEGPTAALEELEAAENLVQDLPVNLDSRTRLERYKAILYAALGRWTEAEALVEWCEENWIPPRGSVADFPRVMWAIPLLMAGRPRDVLAWIERVGSSLDGIASSLAAEMRAQALVALGDVTGALAASRAAASAGGGEMTPGRAVTLLAAGRIDEVLSWLRLDARFVEAAGLHYGLRSNWADLAACLVAVGGTDEAARVAERASAAAGRLDDPLTAIERDLALAVVGRGRGEPDLAALARGLATIRDSSWRARASDMLRELAAALHDLGRHDDAAAALGAMASVRDRTGAGPWWFDGWYTHLEPAARAALGHPRFEERFAAVRSLPVDVALSTAIHLARAGGDTEGGPGRPRPTFGWESLTAAELRVAKLVSEGLTNPEIADALTVARSTVASHLKHIYAKLDIHSRAALAAEAIRSLPS